jgi:prepilin-type processing-associated H-X9-DG protein/prepilin-type N-terminal cleavage/methylation domain-containing protein
MTNLKRPMRRGFTVVELLVVVGVLAVLAAMLMPAMNKARAAARSLRCQSQLRTIGQGFQMYATTYSNFLPPVNSYVSYNAQGTSKNYGMYNAIGPYVGMPQWAGLNDPPLGNTEPEDPTRIKTDSYWGKYKREKFTRTVFYCPDSPKESPQPWFDVSYGESLYLQKPNSNSMTGGGNPKVWTNPRPRGPVPQPANKIHVADGNSWHLGAIADVNITQSFDLYRHNQGTNILFLDGHVEWYDGKSVVKNITRDPASNKSMNNFALR